MAETIDAQWTGERYPAERKVPKLQTSVVVHRDDAYCPEHIRTVVAVRLIIATPINDIEMPMRRNFASLLTDEECADIVTEMTLLLLTNVTEKALKGEI